MSSTYSPDLRIELIPNGGQTDVWGTTTNLNLGSLIEDAIAGIATVATSSAAQALTVSNGAVDQARCAVLSLSTLAGSNFAVYVPPVPKLYVVKNADTTYNLTLYVSTIANNTIAAGSGVTLPPGKSALLRSDGTNIVDQINYVSSALGVGGALSVGGNFSVSGTATLSADPTLALQAATKQYVDAAVAGGVPSGAIVLWSGSAASIPAGWYLCNGSNGTPDLRNRFVVGAGSTYAVGATGGSADAIVVSHTHSASSSQSAHDHTVTSAGARHGTSGRNVGSTFYAADGDSNSSGTNVQSMTSTSASPSISTSISTTGSSGTNANLPPYYALCYIMKA